MSSDVAPIGGQPEVPVCYRHPGRETYVRCVRCNRPICPECMTAASVGFQCPECLREGNRSVRTGRTAFGGRVTGRSNAVTIGIIGINVAVFLLVAATTPAALTAGVVTTIHERFALIGSQVATGQYYRVFTSAFLHYGPLHLAFNMYALWLFGQELERLYGRLRFIAIYLISAFGGGVLAYLISNPNRALAGASGAVFGLFGAYFITARKMGAQTGGLIALVAINLALGFVIPNIGWQAHVGGLITGAAFTAVLAYAPRGPQRTLIQVVGGVVIVVLLVVVMLARTGQLTG
ncbi:MAG: rhomboid family intramembrane serine protease [Mycobacteriales bacterium]